MSLTHTFDIENFGNCLWWFQYVLDDFAVKSEAHLTCISCHWPVQWAFSAWSNTVHANYLWWISCEVPSQTAQSTLHQLLIYKSKTDICYDCWVYNVRAFTAVLFYNNAPFFELQFVLIHKPGKYVELSHQFLPRLCSLSVCK